MDLLNSIISLGWYLIPFVFVLSILVFVHEWGHYWVAIKNGVKVEVFSIGFGTEIFGWVDKNGTRWKVCWLPLGGYVKMYGDEDAASTPDTASLKSMSEDEKQYSLHYKTVWQRIAVTAAGPVANYLFAIIVFSALFATFGQRYTIPRIDVVMAESAAEKAGLQKGDLIKSINHHAISRFEDISATLDLLPAGPVDVAIQRKNENKTIKVEPTLRVLKDRFGNEHRIRMMGIQSVSGEFIKRGPLEALGYALKEVWSLSAQSLSSLTQMIMGSKPADSLGGPLRIAQMSGEVAQSGFAALLYFAGVLSVGLGLLNLFPIPMLDGGHILFYLIEAIRGKPLSEKAMNIGFNIGFALVISLMIFATWNDLVQLRVFQWIFSFIQ